MGEHLGEKYDARISGITSYGIYAEINENHCEGMVPMRDLDDDYYDFDEKNFCLIGRHHHHKYQLGDPVRIQVAQANLEKKQLDFLLLNDQTSPDGKATRTEKTQADKKSGKNRKKHNDEREKKKKEKHVRK